MRWNFVENALAAAIAIACKQSEAKSALSNIADSFESNIQCSRIHSVFKMLHRLCICEPCHACRYSFQSTTCVLSSVLRPGTYNATRLQPIQPVLDPAKWFLTEAEMRASRSGVPRNGLQLYSLGNNITTYPVTSDYYSAILNDMLSVSSTNDRVYFAGWNIANVVMDPRAMRFDQTRLTEILRVVQAKGADIRALIWASPQISAGREVQRVMNDVLPKPFDGSARFVYDDRVPSIVGSHHQKMFIIKRNHQLTAYIGGVDLYKDRWDTITHNETRLRENAGVNLEFKGWIDAQVGIHGPAATDVANNYIARWNARGEPIQQLRDSELGVKNPPHTPLANIELDPTGKYADPLVYPQPGPSAVQIVRTFGCKHKGAYNSFAPKGEFSLHAGIKKALLMAQNFIYIEDQYFVYVPDFLEAMLTVLPRLQRVVIILQPIPTGWRIFGYEKLRYDMLAPMMRQFPTKVQLYELKDADNVCMHGKVILIDDAFLWIGSANWNRRSQSHDTEIGASIVDTEYQTSPDKILVSASAREFRLKRFHEFTLSSLEKLSAMTFLQAADFLHKVAVDQTGQLRPTNSDYKLQYLFYWFHTPVRKVLDPESFCDLQDHRKNQTI